MTKINQAAFDVGQMAERFASAYYSQHAMIAAAAHPAAELIFPPVEAGQYVPIGRVPKKDGADAVYDFRFYLRRIKEDGALAAEMSSIWVAGSLLRMGDALDANDYFDRAPELEMIRHLRNGIAHGNRFRIDHPHKLSKFPAHNKLSWVRDSEFEITPALNGVEIVPGWIEVGDYICILLSVALYLIRMGNGDPLRPSSSHFVNL